MTIRRERVNQWENQSELGNTLQEIRPGKGWIRSEVGECGISLKDGDRIAAWELYVEMFTRVATRRLPSESGDEKTALESIHSLFPTTRGILRQHGREALSIIYGPGRV